MSRKTISTSASELWTAALAFAAGVAPAAMVLFLSGVRDTTPAFFARDAAAYLGTDPLTGSFSTLGGLTWAAAVGVWLSTLVQCRDPGDRRFAFISMILTGYLCLDDIFMGHEYLIPIILRVPEELVLIVIAVSLASYFLLFAKRFLQTPVLAAGAIGFLGLSVFCDILREHQILPDDDWWILAEDGPKFLGIVFWLALALGQMRCCIQPPTHAGFHPKQ